MKRIACIGEAMIELSMEGDQAHLAVAGDTLNTAIYLKRSLPDITVDYVTCLGQDMFSKRIVDFIAANDLGHSNIRRIADKSPGLYAINTAPDGERSFTYWRSDSAARQMFSDADFDFLEQFDGLYLSGITLAILPQTLRLAPWVPTSAGVQDGPARPPPINGPASVDRGGEVSLIRWVSPTPFQF